MSGTPAGLLTLDDYAAAARARLPWDVWDYLAGGAGEERTLAANRQAFLDVRIVPRVLAGAGIADPATRLFGRSFAAPVGIAPCAYHTLFHPAGELATARAAAEARVPFVLSTYAGRSFKEIRAAAGRDAVLWQQLYCFRDRSVTKRLIRDAEEAGVEALVLTVDTPHLGRRLRDLRNGFRLPPGVVPANLPDQDAGSPADHARAVNDVALDWSVVDWLRTISSLPLLLKGILNAADAERALAAGVDGIVVSNHGGRQLDRAPAALEALPAVVTTVAGRVPVLMDGGIRNGTDILIARALGAQAVLVGRPVAHGLAVGGASGVREVLRILTEELRDAMTLSGVVSVDDLTSDLVHGSTVIHAPRTQPEPLLPLHRDSLHASLSDPDLDTMAFLNEIADRFPDAVSFAPGRPYEGLFEVEDVFTAIRRYLDELTAAGRPPESIRSTLYQYGPSAGIIRDLLADSLREDEGIDAAPESLVITVGAQEGMLLVLRALFAHPEDVLLVSTPCYVGIIGAAKLLGIRIVPVPERADGLSPADVDQAIRDARRRGLRPRALYLVPDHSNPSGNTIGLEDRHTLIDLAREHGVLLLEDSPYRLVSPGSRLPTLKALDNAAKRPAADRVVVHIGSFAKSMFPGARVGYVVADQPVAGGTLLADDLARIKSMVTVNTPTLSQAAVAGTLLACRGRLSELNTAAAAHYGENLSVLLAELADAFPTTDERRPAPTWNTPRGGFFLTLNVPFRADAAALARSAHDHGVLWTPMSYFHPGGSGGGRQIRLSFSALTTAGIREGVARLAKFVAVESAGRSDRPERPQPE